MKFGLVLLLVFIYLASFFISTSDVLAKSSSLADPYVYQKHDESSIKGIFFANSSTGEIFHLTTHGIGESVNKSNISEGGWNFLVEKVTGGIQFPTEFAFLDKNDILVLEKTGQVKRVVNGNLIAEPLAKLNVNATGERGLVGLAVSKGNLTEPTRVFLFFTENLEHGHTDNVSSHMVANRLYRYELDDNELVNGKLLINLPAYPSNIHNGGKLIIGPDSNLYLIIGDVGNSARSGAQNAFNPRGTVKPFDGTGGILRLTQDGNAVKGIIAADTGQKYYGYGIRNGYGMGFDPVTGNLWDTENGPSYGDEINLVKPGFNGGWGKVQGIWKHTRDDFFPKPENITYHPDGLADFNGTGKYKSPELSWNRTVGLTAIQFLNTNKLGSDLENDLLVADVDNGNIYHFDLSTNRTGLSLNDTLSDKVVNSPGEINSHIFLSGLGGITDMKVGPDGYLYFSTLGKPHGEQEKSVFSDGSIYRVKPFVDK